MTRITLGELKRAARNPAERRAGGAGSIATPYSMAFKAIREYHRYGPELARRYLHRAITRSSYWGPEGGRRQRSWGEAILDGFDNYIVMAEGDPREYVDTTVRVDVGVGANSVGIVVDVLLLDPRGYVARLPLWDKPLLTRADAQLLAAPLVAGLQFQLGEDRIPGVEVWHLRSETEMFVGAEDALEHLDDVRRVVERYVS